MNTTPTRVVGLVFHAYAAATALAVGFAFGAQWALIPLALGFAVLLIAN